jgi:hypothetical protein
MAAAMQLTSTLSGGALLLASAWALCWSGRALVWHRLAGADRAVRWVGSAVAATSLLVVVSMALLFGQCFRAVPFALASLGVAAAIWWRTRTAPSPTPVGPRGLRLRGAAALLAALCGTLLLAEVARGLLMPPLAWDSLTYHLPVPALWIQHGGYWQWAAPDAWGDYSHYPANGELVAAFLLLPFHGDLLVNLFGVPFLLLGGAAVHGLATELGARGWNAMAAAALWVFAPPAFAYATTQYVDAPMAAEVLAGWLFALRFRRTHRPVDGTLAGAAFGLAAGTKHLGLVPLLVAAAAALWLLLRHRAHVGRGIAGGALAAAATGGPWYVRNWIETGNPVYPFRVAMGGHLLFAGSPLQEHLPQLPATTTFIDTLFVFSPDFAPLTFGPPLVLVGALGLLGMLRGLTGPARAAWLPMAAAVAADLALFGSDRLRHLRDHWSVVSQRFLLATFGLLLVGAATLCRRGERRRQRFAQCLATAALALELTAVNFGTLVGDQAIASLLLILLALAAVLVAWRPPLRWLVLLGALAWFGGLPWLAAQRQPMRHEAFARGFELNLVPRPAADGWREVDVPDRPQRIAFVCGWENMGQNWFVYPLLGSRLQNELLFVPSTASGAPGSYRPDAAEPRTTPDEWIARLRAAGAEVLFVALPAPPELAWAEAHPEVFALRAGGPGFRVFDVH